MLGVYVFVSLQILSESMVEMKLGDDDEDEVEWTFQQVREEFVSQKITRKVEQQLQDALALCGNSLPHWLPFIMHSCRALLPLETRQAYMLSTAFGTTRAITWLQDRLDTVLENASAASNAGGGSASRSRGGAGAVSGDDSMEYRVGRLKHERIRVARSGQTGDLLARAAMIMRVHSDRKSMLEVNWKI